MNLFKLHLLVASLCMLPLLTAANATSHPSTLDPVQKETLVQLKRELFGGLTFQNADLIEQGALEPTLDFTVSDSLFVNWIIPRSKVAAFTEALNLPPGFQLTPISILNGEQPRYYLSLNIYQVTIDQPTLRAEWSVYVTKDGDTAPRFLVIEAASSTDSFDPVSGPVSAVPFQFERKDKTLTTSVSSDKSFFELRLREPRFSFPRFASAEWSTANDLIYWENGVADKVLYNATLTRQPITRIRSHQFELRHESPWAAFTKKSPRHVFLYDKPIEFAVTPWANLQDPSLEITPAWKAQLQGIKTQIYSSLTRFKGAQIFQGLADGIFDFTVTSDVPAFFINFRIPRHQISKLKEKLNLPSNLTLVPVSPFKYRLPHYQMSLNIYLGEGIAAGLRAEWSVYVAEKSNPRQPYYLVVDAATSMPSLDPVNLFTQPAEVFDYSIDANGAAVTNIQFQNQTFKAKFPLPQRAAAPTVNPRWIRANDRVYWRNGVYDRLFYNASVTQPGLSLIDIKQIEIEDGTIWAKFLDPKPLSAFTFSRALEYKISPWFNVESL